MNLDEEEGEMFISNEQGCLTSFALGVQRFLSREFRDGNFVFSGTGNETLICLLHVINDVISKGTFRVNEKIFFVVDVVLSTIHAGQRSENEQSRRTDAYVYICIHQSVSFVVLLVFDCVNDSLTPRLSLSTDIRDVEGSSGG